MAITMELEESVSDSKLHKESAGRDALRPRSSVSLSKSEIIPGAEQRGSDESLKQYRHWVTTERWAELKKMSEVAVKERKVYTIKGGGYPAVRRALNGRGWVEKTDSNRVRNVLNEPQKVENPKKNTLSRVEKMILYKFLEHHSVDFLWTSKRDKYDWLLSNKDVIISRFCRSIFTSKEGLCASLTQMHWHTEPGVALTRFPRCYNIHNTEHLDDFVEDFRLTACISLLKWLSMTLKKSRESDMVCLTGKVPYSAVEFAMKRLTEHIDFQTHNDIDTTEDHRNYIWEHEWDQFLTHHYLLVHVNEKFAEDAYLDLRALEKRSARVLALVTKHWPQMDIDGVLNIWIVKPGNKCRGKGIQLMNNIKDIVGLMNVPTTPKTRYVVQKYIENPLVIYNTKFDIRQWFLITNCQPLTIWMYKDSYLRFSSQVFSLSNYHESVHLTNNAVQSRYKNHDGRDKALPDENMWDCHTFQAYLRQIGKADVWETKIYPGMRQCLVGAMLACQETMDKRQNSFELYGADFMLGEDFTPWLIEINSSPDLAPTTSVTARLCPQCLEDVIKVVIDRRNNPDSSTGTFELVYKQIIPKAPAYLGLTLCLNGKKLFKKQKVERKSESKSAVVPIAKKPSTEEKKLMSHLPPPPTYSGPIITDFLNWLHPYHAFPTDKDGILLPPESSFHSQKNAFTAIKAGVVHTKKKRKSPTKAKSRRENVKYTTRQGSTNRSTSPESSIASKNQATPSKSAKREEKGKAPGPVGNKRCYIDPHECEQETSNAGNAAKTAAPSKNTIAPKVEPVIYQLRTPRPGFLSAASKATLPNRRSGTIVADSKLTSIGQNIRKLQNEHSATKEKYNRILKMDPSFINRSHSFVVPPVKDFKSVI